MVNFKGPVNSQGNFLPYRRGAPQQYLEHINKLSNRKMIEDVI